MKLWIERSQSCPLSLRLSPFHDDNRGSSADSFQLFLHEVDRWQKMDIYLDAKLCELFLTAKPTEGARLERLSLCSDDCTDQQIKQLPTILNKFTRLRKLDFTRGLGAPLLGLRFTSLTHIQLHTPLPLDRCINILSECSSIVEFHLLELDEPIAPIIPANVYLATLKKLVLDSWWVDTGELLCYLTCPALVELSMSHRRNIEYFNDFITRSLCQLNALSLTNECTSENAALRSFSLPSLQSLRSLQIEELEAGSAILRALTFTESVDIPVTMPFLETIALGMGPVPDGLASDMISSRISGITCKKIPVSLKAVRLWFTHRLERFPEGHLSGDVARSWHKSDVRRFKEFRDARISVSWGFSDEL